MNPLMFCYWLNGFFELNDAGPSHNARLTDDQIKVIREHLELVFDHKLEKKAVNTGGVYDPHRIGGIEAC